MWRLLNTWTHHGSVAAVLARHVGGAKHDNRCMVPESEQKPAGASLIATAAAVPPLEPPTCMMLLCGFRTGPPLGLMVVAPKASSCMRVLPRTIPLAFMRRVTRAELLHGILPAQERPGLVQPLTVQAEPDFQDSKLVYEEPDQD